MITYLKRNEINDDRWNDALAKSSNALIYATTYYLDVVSPNWGALIADDYLAIMPVTKNNKFGINYLFQPYLTQQLGVFSIQKIIKADQVKDFIQAIPSQFRFIEINLNSKNTITSLQGNFNLTERINYELNLNKPFEELKKNCSDNILRNYKKALQHKLSIVENLPETDFINFCEQHTSQLPHKKSILILLQKLVKTILSHNTGQLIGVIDKEGNLCAVNFFLYGYKRVINLFPMSSKQGIETGAMTFLLFHQIMKQSGTENVFDLEGSMIEGVARFYRSFGAEEKKYYHLKQNLLPWYLKWTKN